MAVEDKYLGSVKRENKLHIRSLKMRLISKIEIKKSKAELI